MTPVEKTTQQLEMAIADLAKALDRLIRFNRALLTMGAIETPKALEAELNTAFDTYWKHKV